MGTPGEDRCLSIDAATRSMANQEEANTSRERADGEEAEGEEAEGAVADEDEDEEDGEIAAENGIGEDTMAKQPGTEIASGRLAMVSSPRRAPLARIAAFAFLGLLLLLAELRRAQCRLERVVPNGMRFHIGS